MAKGDLRLILKSHANSLVLNVRMQIHVHRTADDWHVQIFSKSKRDSTSNRIYAIP